jgi:hypothetical protein
MSSLSIFENMIISENCGVIKLIPAERINSFVVRHFYTSADKNFPKADTHPVFGMAEHIGAGMMQIADLRIEAGYFEGLSCWSPIVDMNKNRVLNETLIPDRGIFKQAGYDSSVLVNENRVVYLLQNGSKHAIASRHAFESRGFDWEAVLPSERFPGFSELPTGASLQ